jgi:hypothetical protein
MLFETWDKHRGIESLRPFEDLLRPTMRHLAYWIYSNPHLQAGVTESAAIETTKQFLAEWRYGDDRLAAESAARGFVEFCRGRAWVFSDLGADREDATLFQFTHRTFLEYFAAEQIVQDHETTAQLIKVLRPRVRRGDWEVVTQLVLQMQQRRHLGAADKIIAALLGGSQRGRQWSRTVLFCLRSLQSVVPRQATVQLISKCVVELLAGLYAKSPRDRDASAMYRAMIDEMLRCDAENRESLFDTWSSAMLEWLDEEEHGQFALEAVVHAPDGLDALAKAARDWWAMAMQELQTRARESILARASTGDMEAGHDACGLGWMTYSDAVRELGLDFLWFGRWLWAEGSLSISGANLVLESGRLRDEPELLAHLVASPIPWFSRDVFADSYVVGDPRQWLQHGIDDSGLRLLLLAALCENAFDPSADRVRFQESFALLERAEEEAGLAEEEGLVAPLAVRALLSRGDLHATEDLSQELEAMDLDADALRLLRGWMLGNVSLVRR